MMSRPSIEKRVLPTKALCRKRSKVSTSVIRSSSSIVFDRLLRRAERAGLDVMAQPLALFGHEDVREVEADARAVDRAQPLDGLAGIARAFGQRSADQARRQRPQLGLGDAVRLGVERRVADRRRAQRVDRRREVAVAADRLGEVHGADDGDERGRCRGGRLAPRSRRAELQFGRSDQTARRRRAWRRPPTTDPAGTARTAPGRTPR